MLQGMHKCCSVSVSIGWPTMSLLLLCASPPDCFLLMKGKHLQRGRSLEGCKHYPLVEFDMNRSRICEPQITEIIETESADTDRVWQCEPTDINELVSRRRAVSCYIFECEWNNCMTFSHYSLCFLFLKCLEKSAWESQLSHSQLREKMITDNYRPQKCLFNKPVPFIFHLHIGLSCLVGNQIYVWFVGLFWMAVNRSAVINEQERVLRRF